MKQYFRWVAAVMVGFLLIACEKKEAVVEVQGQPVGVPELQSEPVVVVPAVPEVVALKVDDRAQMHGFAKYLPAQTEMLVSVHHGAKAARGLMANRLWRTVVMDDIIWDEPVEELVEEGVEGLADEMAGAPEVQEEVEGDEEGEVSAAAIFGQEVTVGIGQGGGERLANALYLWRLYGYFSMRQMVKYRAAKMDQTGELMGYKDKARALKDLFADDTSLDGGKSGMDVVESMQMPPVFIAMKATDKVRDQVAGQLSSMLQMIEMVGEQVEAVDMKHGESVLKGYRIPGALIAQQIEEQRDVMEAFMTADRLERLLKTLSEKNMVVLSGVIDEYVVLLLGSSLEELALAPRVEDSLVAGDALAFVDAYHGKDLLAVVYASEESSSQLWKQSKGGFADVAAGIRDGLSMVDQFGDTRSLQALLRVVEEREAALRSLGSMSAGRTVMFFDDGLRLESFGGYDSGMLDFASPNRLAPLGRAEDVLLFANMTTDAVFDEKARDYIEALMETMYAVAVKFAELPVEGDYFMEYRNWAKLFDSKFRDDLVSFWHAYSEGVGAGLGKERALVVDMKATMPALPDVPLELVDKAKFPRVTMVAPVVDRAKLAESWQGMNVSLNKLFASAGEVAGMQMPMQRPMSSEKDGHVSWFLSMPMFHDDFVASVTLNDHWFAASTSKNQAADLLTQAAQGGDVGSGFEMRVNFKVLDAAGDEILKLIEENREALDVEEYQLAQSRQIVKGLKELDVMSVHVRRENGQLRGSMHLKVR